MNSNIKIYSDQKFLDTAERFEIFFVPFWGNKLDKQNDPDFGRFDKYFASGQNFFGLSSLADCDLAVFPGKYRQDNPRISEFLALATSHQKKSVFFFNDDSTEEINLVDSYIFRTSFFKSTKKNNEFAIPGFCSDFVAKYCQGVLPLRSKNDRPVISFCGYASTNSKILVALKKILKRSLNPGALIRAKALKILQKSEKLSTNFIIRSSFWGGIYQSKSQVSPQLVRQEFVNNLLNSDYSLCVRGQGNFSYRLYETLSLGRIPVFVNTDCVLPYENYIDWKNLGVWIEERDLADLPERIASFHDSLSNDDFQNLQKKCRATWEEWLSPEGFFRNFYKHF